MAQLPDVLKAAIDDRRTVVIAGPTAAGKSAYALALAQHTPSIILNADSMQVYRDLCVLTARPGAQETAAVEHGLYGHVDAAAGYSVAAWLQDVTTQMTAATASGKLAIIIGGTGLYLSALVDGLSPVPPIPAQIRASWRAKGEVLSPAQLHAELANRDPEMAGLLRPSDPQRVLRALEVIEATGQSLATWQRIPGTPTLAAGRWSGIVIAPKRDQLYARCDARLLTMLQRGALGEVERLQARVAAGEVQADAPVCRALGVPQFAAHLAGDLSIHSALDDARTRTRQFAKRQLSWLRGRMAAWHWLANN
ncbi:MAG: tRNA (adenosine(37)-N6)-dimethylallyltransferase MiaA [Pseudomonadota bacterium]